MLPPKRFDVCRYEWLKADGYGKVCMDGKHFYSTKPENANKQVLAGIRALPPKRFDVCRYEWLKADGYGKVCMDGKHFYSTKPENANKQVLAGIRAHTIDILTEGGQVITTHRRAFGDNRTDISDYSTTLSVLMKNSGAWGNSGLRHETPDVLRDYMDAQPKEKLKDCLRIMNELTNQYGFQAATSAMEMACTRGSINICDVYMDAQPKEKLKDCLRIMNELTNQYGFQAATSAMEMACTRGSINICDVSVLAARITGYGIYTPPEAGPSNQYGFQAATSAMEMACTRGSINICDVSVLAARITGYGIYTPPEAGPSLAVYDEMFLKEGGAVS